MLILMGLLGVFALWCVGGILREQHRKSLGEIQEIERVEREFERIVQAERNEN